MGKLFSKTLLVILTGCRLNATLNTKRRFDPDEFYLLLSKVDRAESAFDKFLLTVEFTTTHSPNSPYYLIERSLDELVNMANADIDLAIG